VRGSGLVAVLAVHQTFPRTWTAAEASLVEETAERTWAALERARAEAEVHALNATLEGRVAERTAEVRRLAARLAVAEQAERERIALVLHDDLQQQHYALSMVLDLLRGARGPSETGPLLDKASAVLGTVLETTRTLVSETGPTVLQAARLRDVLEWVADEKLAKYGLEVAVEVRGEPAVPDRTARVVLYEALREVLFNVVKHAGVQTVRVTAYEEGGEVVVRVEDDGPGFDPAAARAGGSTGFGLFSVRERLGQVGGRLEVDSAPGRGARLTLAVPAGVVAPVSP
jgi:signal transduction histidine kinase